MFFDIFWRELVSAADSKSLMSFVGYEPHKTPLHNLVPVINITKQGYEREKGLSLCFMNVSNDASSLLHKHKPK